MTPKLLRTTLTSLEEELKVLKAQVKGLVRPKKRLKSFAHLEGSWKEKTDFSWEEIQLAKTKMNNIL